MKMCAALARLGHDVTLVTKLCPDRQEAGVDDEFGFYGVPPSFEVVKLPRPLAPGGSLRYLWGMRRLLRGSVPWDLVYCRDLGGAWLAVRRGLPVLFEAHGLPAGRGSLLIHKRLLAAPSLRRLVVISGALEQRWRELELLAGGVTVVVAHDGADALDMPAPAAEGAPDRPRRIGYVGHLYEGRGVEVLVTLAGRLPQCEFHVIGGREPELASWRSRATGSNLIFHGFVPPGRLAETYAMLDVLLMPYQRQVAVAGGRSDTSDWMSPMKLFEYMATGRPIISSDLPVLREVLVDRENALLVPADKPDCWENALRELLEQPDLRRRLGRAARQLLLDEYTWDARARRVLHGL
jgi:glycosyltransferase involved in cell wall biosynthesis